MKIDYSSTFAKAFRKRIAKNPQLVRLFREKVNLFQVEPYNAILRTHKLTGSLDEVWSFSVKHDCRILFEFKSDDHVLFIDIGKHDEVY